MGHARRLGQSLFLLLVLSGVVSAQEPPPEPNPAPKKEDPAPMPEAPPKPEPVTPPAVPMPVGHRGLPNYAPENTLSGFAACLNLRLGYELDVRRTKDGHLVCLHDDTLSRTTGCTFKVDAVTLAELEKLDAGSSFHPAYKGEPIPTVGQVFEQVARHPPGPTLILVDLKVNDADLAPEMGKLVARHGLDANVVFIGNAIDDPKLREQFRAISAMLQIAVLAETPTDFAKALSDPHANWLYLRFVPTPEQVAEAHQQGKKVIVVGESVAGNEPRNWLRAADAKVDAVLTDHPLKFRKTVGRPAEPVVKPMPDSVPEPTKKVPA